MTMKEAAQSALDVQSAVNLSGVVRSFAEICSWMRLELHFDTKTCNEHPVCRLFAEQVAHLTGTITGGVDNDGSYSKAYEQCTQLAQQ